MENKKREQFFDKFNEEEKAVQIPYYLHEGEMFRLERLNKRWFIAFLVVLIMLFVTNAAWIYYEMQWETITVTQESEDGYNNYIGNDGDIYNGESKTNSNSAQEENQVGDKSL